MLRRRDSMLVMSFCLNDTVLTVTDCSLGGDDVELWLPMIAAVVVVAAVVEVWSHTIVQLVLVLVLVGLFLKRGPDRSITRTLILRIIISIISSSISIIVIPSHTNLTHIFMQVCFNSIKNSISLSYLLRQITQLDELKF